MVSTRRKFHVFSPPLNGHAARNLNIWMAPYVDAPATHFQPNAPTARRAIPRNVSHTRRANPIRAWSVLIVLPNGAFTDIATATVKGVVVLVVNNNIGRRT